MGIAKVFSDVVMSEHSIGKHGFPISTRTQDSNPCWARSNSGKDHVDNLSNLGVSSEKDLGSIWLLRNGPREK